MSSVDNGVDGATGGDEIRWVFGPPPAAAAAVSVRSLQLLPPCQSAPCSCCCRASSPALDIRPTATTRQLPPTTVTGWQPIALELGSRQSSSSAVVHHFEKITKGGSIHGMKQHLVGVKEDIGPCKSVPPDVRFRMENSLQEFVNSKKETQEAYEERNPYGPNVSQFEGDMAEGEEEAKVGCTIMGDGWIDNRQRTLINFLVYCPEGISFVKSVDASDIVKDASNLFLLFDEVIEWVGPLNVVHIVTDNATNYVAAGRLISQKHKHINWSPCATHCLNLIFKDIEILRLGATRFATTFIALKSLHDHKHDLQALVTSKFFVDFRYSKDNKSKVAVSIILDNRFWNDCLIVVNLMSPLMRLLRIVDCDERPSMGYVYEGMYRKVLKGKLETMNEMKLFRDRLGSFGRDLAYSSREVLQPVDDDQPVELDVEELETLLYEEGSIPINEVEGSSSHIDNEDGGDVAIEGLDVENFGFPDAYFQSPYSNFQNE
ncbi:hypothetical protein CK203_016952 [Vitis vinifera]|uniref:DUF659 domain-containing protein n=1 Tax=Vitis vinifera TaxID=29760 RepID=A0A438JNP6_VITVI|nr:hypothetical protein CK203_016952 [Vitis vinifera]